jgi:hypothetical protein
VRAELDALMQKPVESSLHSIVFGPYSSKALRTDIAIRPEHASPGGGAEDAEVHPTWLRALWDLTLSPLDYKWGDDIVQGLLSLLPSAGILSSELFVYEPDRVQPGTRYFDPAPAFSLYTLEYALDRATLPQAYTRVMRVLQRYWHERPKTYVLRFWARFQNAVETPYSLPYGRDTALLEVTIDKQQPRSRELALELGAILTSLGGRPHMGKTVLSPSELVNYDWRLLQAAIRKYDPHGVFRAGPNVLSGDAQNA